MALTRMQQRRGSTVQWDTANTTLASGEIGVNTDNYQFKIGNGLSTWSELDYFQTEGGGRVTVSETPPENPENGDPWFDSTIGNLYIYYVDDDSGQWVEVGGQQSVSLGLNELNDVDTSGVQDGNSLVYNETQSKWIPGASGTSSLNNLTDVTITSATADQLLRWSGTTWVNGTANTGSITNDAVTTAKIADINVTAAKIASNAVTEIKIASNAVTTAKIASNAVTTAKIADNNVTEAKLATAVQTKLNDSITTNFLLMGA